MRPTGQLHLGHLVGALQNWVGLQAQYDCFYFVADWHALTTDYADTSQVTKYAYDNAIDWIADLRPRLRRDPSIRRNASYSLADRLFVGGLKNLLAGVTTVAHHNPHEHHGRQPAHGDQTDLERAQRHERRWRRPLGPFGAPRRGGARQRRPRLRRSKSDRDASRAQDEHGNA